MKNKLLFNAKTPENILVSNDLSCNGGTVVQIDPNQFAKDNNMDRWTETIELTPNYLAFNQSYDLKASKIDTNFLKNMYQQIKDNIKNQVITKINNQVGYGVIAAKDFDENTFLAIYAGELKVVSQDYCAVGGEYYMTVDNSDDNKMTLVITELKRVTGEANNWKYSSKEGKAFLEKDSKDASTVNSIFTYLKEHGCNASKRVNSTTKNPIIIIDNPALKILETMENMNNSITINNTIKN